MLGEGVDGPRWREVEGATPWGGASGSSRPQLKTEQLALPALGPVPRQDAGLEVDVSPFQVGVRMDFGDQAWN